MKNTKTYRVIHFTPYFPPHSGGLELYVRDWALNFPSDLGRVAVVTLSSSSESNYQTEENYVLISLPAFDLIPGFPVPKFWDRRFWKGLQEAKKWQPDIVHTHTRFFLSSLFGGIFAKMNHITWIHIEHGSGFVFSENRLITFLAIVYDMTIGKWVTRNADAVVAISEAVASFIGYTFGVSKIQIIYRGITRFSSQVFRSQDEIYIGYVGRLVDLKGVDILLEAFALFHEKYIGKKAIKLKILGDGPMKDKLEKQSEKLTLRDKIEFLGQKDNLFVRTEFFPSMHIVVNPSHQEGLPTTVMEALVDGCCVIATDVGGTKEIQKMIPFVLIPPGDVYALEQALALVIEQIEDQIETTSQVFFSWENTFLRFRSLYNSIKR